MTDLTEQYQKGELPEGWYYIKDENGVIYAAENCLNYDSLSDKGYTAFYYAETEISEILAPVPTYSEYLALQSDSLAKDEGAEIVAELEKRLKKTQGIELDLRRKNHELKELLKECKEMSFGIRLALSSGKINDVFTLTYKIENKINQALGEDK
jgi:hypothetical protein